VPSATVDLAALSRGCFNLSLKAGKRDERKAFARLRTTQLACVRRAAPAYGQATSKAADCFLSTTSVRRKRLIHRVFAPIAPSPAGFCSDRAASLAGRTTREEAPSRVVLRCSRVRGHPWSLRASTPSASHVIPEN